VGQRARAISIGSREPAYSPPAESIPTHAEEEFGPAGRIAPEGREWDAFISHASEDKPFVAPLARALQRSGLKIWYDDVSLGVGNSLRESIDFGLTRSRYGIVVFSRHYFAKSWTRQAVNGLLSREIGGVHVVLPIWHNVSPSEVLHFSPILADRVAARSSENLETVVEKLVRAIRTPQETRLNG
jgi:TIR domain